VRPKWKGQQKVLWTEIKKETGRWKSRWKVRDLPADERHSRAVLDFLSTTDVGRLVPAPVEEDAQSETLEWQFRERSEREEVRRREAEELGEGGEEQPLFLPTPSFMVSTEEEWSHEGDVPLPFFSLSFVMSFLIFLGAPYHHLGTGLGRGQRKACNVPPLRRETVEKVRRHSLYGLNASMIKQKKKRKRIASCDSSDSNINVRGLLKLSIWWTGYQWH
jgi:hypothetical protein